MDFYIYNFFDNDSLSLELKSNFANNLGEFEIKVFADGEKQVVIKNVLKNEDIYIISQAKTSEDWLTLLMALEALCKADTKSINVLLPYMGYLRQDAENDNDLRCSSLKLFTKLLEQNGATQVVVIDPHCEMMHEYFKKTKFTPLLAQALLGDRFQKFYKKQHTGECLAVVAPDKGSEKLALAYQKTMSDLDVSIVTMQKKRLKANVVESMQIMGDVSDKNVVLVDDMADTCGTLITAVNILRKQGARKIYAIVTHPILSGDAQKKIQDSSIVELFVSNTINLKTLTPKIKVVEIDSIIVGWIYNSVYPN